MGGGVGGFFRSVVSIGATVLTGNPLIGATVAGLSTAATGGNRREILGNAFGAGVGGAVGNAVGGALGSAVGGSNAVIRAIPTTIAKGIVSGGAKTIASAIGTGLGSTIGTRGAERERAQRALSASATPNVIDAPSMQDMRSKAVSETRTAMDNAFGVDQGTPLLRGGFRGRLFGLRSEFMKKADEKKRIPYGYKNWRKLIRQSNYKKRAERITNDVNDV